MGSEDTEVLSSHEGDKDEEEEEESNSPLKGEKKRAAAADLEAEAPKGGKISLRMIQIRTLKPSLSGASGRSPRPNHKYLKILYIHLAFLQIIG